MGETKLFSVFDKKTGSWDRPYAARTHGEAERMFKDAINRGESLLGSYPEDFSLWCVGAFDESTGQIKQLEQISLGEAVNFKKSQILNQGKDLQ